MLSVAPRLASAADVKAGSTELLQLESAVSRGDSTDSSDRVFGVKTCARMLLLTAEVGLAIGRCSDCSTVIVFGNCVRVAWCLVFGRR